MLTDEEIDEIVRRIVVRMDPLKVIIFGSYAKGTATASSDLDVLVVKDTELPMASRVEELRPILETSVFRVDVHVYTQEEVDAYGSESVSFIRSVLRTGRLVYTRSA